MKIKHEHIESVLLALAAEKGQAWVANAITEEYLRQGGGELPLVPGKDWNNPCARAASPSLHLRYPGPPCITGGAGSVKYGN